MTVPVTVTVVDAASFARELTAGDSLVERRLDQYAGDERTVSDLLMDQVEFADVLLLNRTDLVPDVDRLVATLRRLNPAADVVTGGFGKVPLERVFGTGRYDPARLWDFVTRRPGSGEFGAVLRSKGSSRWRPGPG